MLSSGYRDQLCSSPVVLLWSWLFTVLVYWGLISLPHPLSLGQHQWSISWPPAVSMWWFAVFQFCRAIWLWVLLTGSGDELCGPLPALFQTVAYHPPTVSPPAFPALVYWKFMQISAPCPLSFSGVLSASCPLCCVLVFSSLLIVLFFFFAGGSQSAQGAMLVYTTGLGIPSDAWHSPVWLSNVSQAGLEQVSVGSPPIFSV
jgi:hypothetical protein